MLGHEVTRWHPFVLGGHRDLDAVLDRFLGRREPSGGRTPALNAYAEEGRHVLRLDLPGVDPKDLDIEVEGRRLTVRGERKVEEKDPYYREAFHGRFERTVRLPNGVDTDKIEARYRNGVIEVSVPLPVRAAGRKVPIQGEGGEAQAIEPNAG